MNYLYPVPSAVLIAVAGIHPVFAQTGLVQPCGALDGIEVPAGAIGLPSGPAAVTSAVQVAASPRTTDARGEIVLELPSHCRLQGTIAPLDPEAPPVRFNINLPEPWNGKALHSGGGGLGGTLNTAPGEKAFGRFDPQPYDDSYPLTDGYATFGGDDGHARGDVGFIYNDEALRNWAGDSLKKTRDVAVWLIERAYGRGPQRLYFSGESAGGREAMFVTQRFPQAYDGAIAVTPVLGWNYTHIADNRIRSALLEGWLDAAAIALIADTTRATCDADDGLVDGILARYMECRMDAHSLRCPNGTTGQGCLSDAQIASLNAIREPWATAVPFARGVNRFPGYGVTGDEDNPDNQYAFYMVGTTPPVDPVPPGRGTQPGLGAILNFAVIWVRHAIAQEPSFEPHGFYPPAYTERIQYLSGLFDATDPDLAPFRARGGKLIIMHQSADNAVSTPMVAEYYRSVVAALGVPAADDVVRLYIGPGGTHNGTGVAQADLLGLLETWVENGDAPPAAIPVHDIDPATHERKRSMLACRYPRYARYDGSGDIGEAASYACADRADPLAYRTVAQ